MKPKIQNAHADKEIYNYHSKKKKIKKFINIHRNMQLNLCMHNRAWQV